MRDGVRHIVGFLNNTQDPIKLGRVSEDDPIVKYLTVAKNVDIDNNHRASTRNGRVLRYAGTPHSMYVPPSQLDVAYFVEAAVLKKLNTDWTATSLSALNVDAPASFTVINGEVVMSNSDQIGWVDSLGFTPFAQNLLDENELLMPAGQFLCFDDNDGCLLVASGSVVYKSKPWNPMVYDKRVGRFPMNGYIRMLAAVEDGWYVGTEKNVSFVKRDGEDGFTFVHISDVPPINGCFKKSYDFDDEGRSFMFVVWASVDGFNVGQASAKYENLSSPNVVMPRGSSGKLFIRTNNGISQYLATIFNPVDEDNYVAPNLTVNSATVTY